MFYERFQNLDLDKAELEVFKLFFWDSIVLFVDRAPVRIGVPVMGRSWYVEKKGGNNITTSFVALSPCKHAQMDVCM
ncbi:hypothetical protein N7489_001126 [Penicillium chrysogenum]|uniref:uncharacterized protein n=1 Tax=Penicillium chrysogenum TaxID=5076 RepID=UPI0024DF0EA5|nr:uncharacterized protein N7489_001126 [Penicillium chrysogenum]KAJ5250716.1 hypothetical protein N7489_001126 [Penicillium chrysogenum]